jgi:DNA-binding GntR family transcriptional regulator
MAHEGAPFQPITKARLSQEVRRQLLERIADGRLAPSTRLFEAEAAKQLGVSRTPLHEAMVSLSRDGLVESLGLKGWRVTALSESEASEIFPVLASLTSLALALSGALVLGSLDELQRLASIEREAPGPTERLLAHGNWHEVMLTQCPNRVLVQTLPPLLVRATRYERVALGNGRGLPSELGAVMECLGRGDTVAASKLLERHWRERSQSIIDGMRPASSTEKQGAPVPAA